MRVYPGYGAIPVGREQNVEHPGLTTGVLSRLTER
jgi:hypothetical protein